MYYKYFLENNNTGDKMIKDIMSSKIISSDTNATFIEISNLMKSNNIGFIPIKDKDNFVGVITDRDICLSISKIKNLNETIESYMTKSIISIEEDSNISDALKLMSKNKVKRLLVRKKDSITGVLSLSDIINYSDCDILNTLKSIFSIHDNLKTLNSNVQDFKL